MYIVSACLAGVKCRYNGEGFNDGKVLAAIEGKDHILLCPEVLGGFPVPRPPAEIRDGRVYNDQGLDVTEGFVRGAEETYQAALRKAGELGQEIEGAIMKARSPSCGCGQIYDGTFTHKIVSGDGIASAYLKKMGIEVLTEEDL